VSGYAPAHTELHLRLVRPIEPLHSLAATLSVHISTDQFEKESFKFQRPGFVSVSRVELKKLCKISPIWSLRDQARTMWVFNGTWTISKHTFTLV